MGWLLREDSRLPAMASSGMEWAEATVEAGECPLSSAVRERASTSSFSADNCVSDCSAAVTERD